MAVRVLVDADACPGVEEIARLGAAANLEVHFFCNHARELPALEGVAVHRAEHGSADAADWAMLNVAQCGDVAVTQDWALAALLVGKGVRTLSTRGREYSPAGVDAGLEKRHALRKARRAGGRPGGGPPPMTAADRARLLETLARVLAPLGARERASSG